MRVNQNFSRELDLYLKINLTRLFLTRSVLHRYKKAINPKNQVRKPRITIKSLIDTRQVTSKASTTKIKSKEQLRVSDTFHRTPDVRDTETTPKVQ
jgi:hypothetical protein